MRTKCPKKTIVSSKYQPQCYYNRHENSTCWSRRNDSTNVCSALQTSTVASECNDSRYFSEEEEDVEPRRLTIYSKSRPPHEVCKKGCPSCYCNEMPVAPLFHCDNKVDNCACKTAIKNPTCNNSDVHSVFLKYSQSPRKRPVFETYTKRRQNYENYSANYFLHLKSQLAKLEEEMQEVHRCNNLVNYKDECQTRNCNNVYDREKRSQVTQDLIDFRKKNFFACHSSELKDNKLIPEHQCEHDFTLNDRLRAIPNNVDVFGVSRCKTCYKPVSTQFLSSISSKRSSSTLNKSSRGTSSVRIPSQASTISKTCNGTANNINRSLQCSPNRLVYDLGSECLNFEIPKAIYKDLEKSLKVPGYRKPPPTNSMALRFQKGVY